MGTRFCMAIVTVLASLLPAFSAGALNVNGKDVEDIYAYILQMLEEQKKAEEVYEEKARMGLEYRGNKPYAFNALRHLSMDDIIYGAIQGGLTAVREMGPNATPEQVSARAEANIALVLDMLPVLANNFVVGEKLLHRMRAGGRGDFMQRFLLRRCKPGIAGDSLFALYWREELIRNRTLYIAALGDILDNPMAEADIATLALELYADVVEARYQDSFQRDSGAKRLMESQPGLTPAAIMGDPALVAQLEDAEKIARANKDLSVARRRIAEQLDPAMQRSAEIVEQATAVLAALDERHPHIAAMSAPTEGPSEPAPAMDAVPMDESTSAPEEAPAIPRLGIPTLSF